jgi:hypothetical protein
MKYCGKEHWNHVEGWACVLEAGHEGKCREACAKEFVGLYMCLRPKGHDGDCEGNVLTGPDIIAFDPTIRRFFQKQEPEIVIRAFDDVIAKRYILGTNHPHLKEPLTLANPAPTRP